METITLHHLESRNYWMVKVSILTGISTDAIMSRKRTSEISEARHLVSWALNTFEKIPVNLIAILLRRDFRSINYAIRKIENYNSINNKDIYNIKNQLKTIYYEERKNP